MSDLVGPPVQGGAYILGQKKKLDEFEPFGEPAIAEMVAAAQQLIDTGAPQEIPAGMPIRDLCRLARTLQLMAERIKELEAENDEESHEEE
jgi:hypothetical protein